MAVYKVPQDVEAEDKLLGPFSFKQFIFLIVMVIALALAYGLSRLLLPLAIIPLPIAIFFGALALPLRKDQPMEVYLAAIISFILKPKKRLWQADGIESLIEILAPKNEERTYGKGYGQEEVQRRLSYLANLVDSHGWSVRGVDDPNSSMRADLYNEAQQTDDLLDENNSTSRQIDDMITKANDQRRQDMINRIKQPQPATQPIQTVAQATPIAQPNPAIQTDPAQAQITQTIAPEPQLTINPYPTMQQSMLTPVSDQSARPLTQQSVQPAHTQTTQNTQQAAPPTPKPSAEAVSPAIIDLARNHQDLSVETIQREANRIRSKELEEEVVISLH